MDLKQITITAIDLFAQVLMFLILVRVILSWLPIKRDSAFVRFILTLTEPILSPIRHIIQKSPLGSPGMMLDFSPIIAWLVINLLTRLLRTLIWQVL